jgi:uncharacterized oxidoreductase
MPTISANELREFAVKLLAAGGANEQEAQRVGESLIGANLRGYESHGVMRIPFYLDQVAQGDIVPNAEFEIVKEGPATLAVNGNWGFGQVLADQLTRKLIEKAHLSGTATGTMYHSSHIGRLGEYCEMAAAENLVSIVMVNTHGVARRVAPPGGKAPRLGTNPLAIGVPFEEGAIVLDFSTSATAEGKVRVKKIAGEQCPEGWLLDSDGRPTTDPNDLYADPPGTILPMGGEQTYKGFGLALMIDIFCGAISGGLCSRETPITPNGNCVYMTLLDPDHFGGSDHFAREVSQLVSFVRGCPRIDGVERILLPGDPERLTLKDRSSQGIFLDDGNWGKLTELAAKLNVSVPT